MAIFFVDACSWFSIVAEDAGCKPYSGQVGYLAYISIHYFFNRLAEICSFESAGVTGIVSSEIASRNAYGLLAIHCFKKFQL